jgi:two-component system sensor histidine kinase/response regulator
MGDTEHIQSSVQEDEIIRLERWSRTFRWSVDRDGRFTYVSAACEGIIGYSPGELVGIRLFFDLFPRSKREELEKKARTLFSQKEAIVDFQCQLRHKKGRLVWVSTNANPLIDEASGELIAYEGTHTDITPNKLLESNLVLQQSFLNGILDAIRSAITVLAPDGTIIFANPAALDVLGLKNTEGGLFHFDNRLWRILDLEGNPIPENDLPHALAIKTRQPVTDFRHAIVSDEGEQRILQVQAMPTFKDDGSIESVILSTDDITESYISEQQLENARHTAEEASQAKSQFLANMSHELRTPLNGILGMTQILQYSDLRPTEQEHLQTITESSQELLRLVDHILEAARCETLQLPRLALRPFSLRDLLTELLDKYQPALEEKGLESDLELDPALPETMTSCPETLRKALHHLMENSLNFTRSGCIALQAFPKKQFNGLTEISIEVIDTGIGFPLARKEELFSPFTQADYSSTREQRGAGVGLSIANALVKHLGGTLEVVSPVPSSKQPHADPGTVFTIRLPFRP